jgi:integrase
MRAKKTARGYFEASIKVGVDEHGNRIRKRIRAKTEAAFKEKKRAAEREAHDGHILPGQVPTLSAALDAWLRESVERYKRPATWQRYEMDVRNHIKPRFGEKKKVDKLTHRDVQLMVNFLHDSGLAPRSVRNVRSALRVGLRYAKRQGWVRENVADGEIELPSAAPPKVVVLEPQQIRDLLAAVEHDRLKALYWIAFLGLRLGELTGLKWQDIDLDEGVLSVRVAAKRIKRPRAERSKIEEVDTKTKKGVRVIPIPPQLLDILREHRTRQDMERLYKDWQEHDLVFCTTVGTYLGAPNLHRRSFKPALQRAGLADMRIHDLRHSAVVMLLGLGVDMPTVSYMVGHASVDFTLRVYGHELPSVVKGATVLLGQLLSDSSQMLEIPQRAKV